MKKLLLLSGFLVFALAVFAQSGELIDFNQERLQKQKTGMLILGGWAVGNIATGLALAGRSSGPDKYFHQMNAGWNVVNLAIAGFGYYGALQTDPATLDLYASVREHYKFQKLLLFNAGLDVGYILGGAYLIERSNRPDSNNPDRLKGFGRSIMLQGGFLFAFDLINYFVQAGNNPQLQQLLSQTRFNGNSIGINLLF